MAKAPLTIPIKQKVVNLRTGEVVEENTVQAGVILAQPKPGECELCNKAHGPNEPHNAQAMAYQYRFYAKEGRFPNWLDAMAHCSPEMQELWTRHLEELGVDVQGGGVNPRPKGV